jgi:MFS transporter, FHS family, glucose/mannose:H+ symporter
MFIFAMVFTVTSPLLIEISKTYSLDMVKAGIIFSVISFGFVIFTFITGFLSEKFGKHPVISISFAGLTVFLFAIPFAANYYVLCIFMFFIGGFGGTIESQASSVVAEINTVKKIYYQNLIQVFFGIGAFVGPAGAGVMVFLGIPWKLCFFILGIFSLVFMVLFMLSRMGNMQDRDNEGSSKAGVKEIFTDLKFLVICICVFLYTGSEIGSWGWMSSFLKQNIGFSIFQAGLAVGLFWVSMTVGRIFLGEASLKVNVLVLIIALSLSSFAVTLASVFVFDKLAVWIVVALMGLSFSSIWPFIVAYGGEHKKSSSGMVFAALIGSGGLGGMVIPYLMGVAGQNINTKIPMLIPSVLFMIVAVIFIFFYKQKSASK